MARDVQYALLRDMTMKVNPQANTAKVGASVAKDGASGFFGRSADASRDPASSFQSQLRHASSSLDSGRQSSARANTTTVSSDGGTTTANKQETHARPEKSGQGVKSESSARNVKHKQGKDKKSAPASDKRILYAAVNATGTVLAKGASVAAAGLETNDPTGKTRNGEPSAAGRKRGAEAPKSPDTNVAAAKAELSPATPAVDESAKSPGASEHGKPEMTAEADSKVKPADPGTNVPGPNATTGAEAHGTKGSKTEASAPTQANPSTTAVSKAAATVSATMKDSGVQATTTSSNPPRHDETASKATPNPLDSTHAGAATGPAQATTATVAAHMASTSGSGADSRSSHGDKGKNGNSAPRNQAGTGQKEAGASSTTSGLAGSMHNVKGAGATSGSTQATSATGGTSAVNASASAASHAQSGQSTVGQSGSAGATASHDAPVAHTETGQVAGAESGISRIQDARLISRANRAEMSVQLETNELGPVQLHATVAGSRIGATISVERPETQWLLASKLGVLHQALNDRNLRVDRIDVVSGSGTNMGGQTGTGTPYGGGRAWHQSAGDSWTGTTSQMPTETAAEEITTTSSVMSSYRAGRLSVRA